MKQQDHPFDSYNRKLWRHFFVPLLTLLVVAVIGIIGFMRLNHATFLEAFYMVVVTLTTVGYRQDEKLSAAGILFDSIFVMVSVVLIVVVIGRALEFIVSGEFVRIRRKRKMEKKIEGMKGHFIICGYGRVGHQVAVELKAAKIPYVVIDGKPETAVELEDSDVNFIIGDGSHDIILEQAGVRRAKVLVAANDSDTANVFVTLSARVINPGITIVSRASSVESEEKMRKAGANKVISPYFIAGKRMAALATKPTAIDFVDTVMHSEHLEMEIREFQVDDICGYAGKTLGEAQIRQRSGAYVAAIRKTDGKFNLQPVAESKIDHGDIIVAIGTPKQLELLEKCLIK
jgi:voltage-gated potassium channel